MICGVCDVLPSKYKCPACRKPYCSLPCWKTHKEGECAKKQEKKDVTADSSVEVIRHNATYNYPTDDTVEPEQLKLLEQSKKLKQILSSPHVQAKLAEVDAARNPALAIRNAMHEPIFVEFADECMHILEPWTKDQIENERLLN